VRLQVTADRPPSKHIRGSRHRDKAGRRPGRPRRQGGRRGDQLRNWRMGGAQPTRGRDSLSLPHEYYERGAV